MSTPHTTWERLLSVCENIGRKGDYQRWSRTNYRWCWSVQTVCGCWDNGRKARCGCCRKSGISWSGYTRLYPEQNSIHNHLSILRNWWQTFRDRLHQWQQHADTLQQLHRNLSDMLEYWPDHHTVRIYSICAKMTVWHQFSGTTWASKNFTPWYLKCWHYHGYYNDYYNNTFIWVVWSQNLFDHLFSDTIGKWKGCRLNHPRRLNLISADQMCGHHKVL